MNTLQVLYKMADDYMWDRLAVTCAPSSTSCGSMASQASRNSAVEPMSPDLTYPTRQFTSGVASLNIPPTPPTPNSMGGQQKSPNHLVVPQPVKPRPNGKSFQCKMCEQKFLTKSEVHQHARIEHKQDNKGYQCAVCSKTFSSIQQLNQHQLVHSGNRPHRCNFCDKSFKQLSHLQQHRRMHTGERPYKCTFEGCDRGFAQLSNLQHHIRNHEKHTEKASTKEFECIVCKRRFNTPSSLETHCAKTHAHLTQDRNGNSMEKNTEYLQLLHDPPVRLTISQKRLLNPQPVEPFEEVHVVPLEGLHKRGRGRPRKEPRPEATISTPPRPMIPAVEAIQNAVWSQHTSRQFITDSVGNKRPVPVGLHEIEPNDNIPVVKKRCVPETSSFIQHSQRSECPSASVLSAESATHTETTSTTSNTKSSASQSAYTLTGENTIVRQNLPEERPEVVVERSSPRLVSTSPPQGQPALHLSHRPATESVSTARPVSSGASRSQLDFSKFGFYKYQDNI